MAIQKDEFMRMLNYSRETNAAPKLFSNASLEMKEFDKALNFEDDFNIEMSVVDFLDAIGFRPLDSGYKFLRDIIVSCIKKGDFPKQLKRLYEECAVKYNVSKSTVEGSITKAITNASENNRIFKINQIFQTEVFDDFYISGRYRITNGHFLACVCVRFIIAKAHNQRIYYRL